MSAGNPLQSPGAGARDGPAESRMREASAEDASAIALIYNHYVSHSVATFEIEPVHPSVMADRVNQCRNAGLPWLLAERAGEVLGYAYAVQWKPRHAYRHSCETTIYLHPEHTGRGLGVRLYSSLLGRLRAAGCHTAIGGVALPNPASIALHERLGFRKVAQFREVGFKQNRWIDVGYWQLMLDSGTGGRNQNG